MELKNDELEKGEVSNENVKQSCDDSSKDNLEKVLQKVVEGFKDTKRMQELLEKYKYHNPKRTNRTYNDRKKSNIRLRQDKNNDEKEKPRIIGDLTCTNQNTVEEIAKEMAEKLNEECTDTLGRVIEFAGKHKAFEIFKETKKIEEEGGMLIMNHGRRRTSGGVFFFLVKNDSSLTAEQIDKIFDNDQKFKKYKKEYSNKTTTASHANDSNKGKRPLLLNQTKNLDDHSNKTARSIATDKHSHAPSKSRYENSRRVATYEEDFLDLNNENITDFF